MIHIICIYIIKVVNYKHIKHYEYTHVKFAYNEVINCFKSYNKLFYNSIFFYYTIQFFNENNYNNNAKIESTSK